MNSSKKFLKHRHWKMKLEREAGLKNPVYLIQRLLNVKLEPFHARWIDFVDLRPRSLILAPRGHGKTTAITVGYTLWNVLKNQNIRALILSNTQAQAESFLREIKMRLESSIVRSVFGEQRGPKWTDSEIIVKNSRRASKEATVTALGVMGAVISRHFDMVVLDDIVDEENARTSAQREKLRTWYYTTLMPTLEPHGKLIIIGTRYHLNDLYGYLCRGPFKNDFIRMKALDSDGVPLWQSKFSRQFLEKTRSEAGPVIFNAQYQNDVELMRNRIFQQDWLLRYDREPKELKIAIGADLAIGMENHNDYFALVAVGRDDAGRFYVLDAMRGRFTFEEQFRKIVEMYHKHDRGERRVVRVGVEATAYQEALPQRLRRETALPVVSIKPAVDKVSRAHALTAFFESGRVFFRDDASQSALIEELILFPDAEHDDLFDALEIAINLCAESAGYSDIFRRKIPDVLPHV